MNILFLVHRVPYPPNRGDRIRSFHLLRFLAERHQVHLACLADEPTPPEHVAALREWCARVAVVPLPSRARWWRAAVSLARGQSATEGLFGSPALDRLLSDWSYDARFDVALAFCSSMIPYLAIPRLNSLPAVVDLVDVDSQKWFDYAAGATGPKGWLFALEGRRVQKLEQRAIRRAAAIAVVSPSEAKLASDALSGHIPRTGATIHAIRNGVDLDYFSTSSTTLTSLAPGDPEIVFVGALDYRANIEGVIWFCRQVWPAVRERLPHATLTLVGRNPTPAVRQLTKTLGVRVVGDVPDVRPYLTPATFTIAPLRVARGIQNKVLESLSAGRPVVATSEALVGLDLIVGLHALRADSRDEWIAAIERLATDSDLRGRLAAKGREYVAEHHDWNACLAPFDELLRSAAGETSDARSVNGAVDSAGIPTSCALRP